MHCRPSAERNKHCRQLSRVRHQAADRGLISALSSPHREFLSQNSSSGHNRYRVWKRTYSVASYLVSIAFDLFTWIGKLLSRNWIVWWWSVVRPEVGRIFQGIVVTQQLPVTKRRMPGGEPLTCWRCQFDLLVAMAAPPVGHWHIILLVPLVGSDINSLRPSFTDLEE